MTEHTPFTVPGLIDEASAKAGLSNFGDLLFEVGFGRFVDSLNREAGLSDLGKVVAHDFLLETLVTRLKVEEWYRLHPEIDDEVVRDPVLILGLPRTGSTVLGNMLALDRSTRSLRGWEAYEPCPPPDVAMINDRRIEENLQRTAQMNALVPGLREALPRTLDGAAPEECYILLNYAFGCVGINGMFHVPGFEDWVMTDNLPEVDAAYRYHLRVIKLLQWKTPAKRWVLRSPLHIFQIRSLLNYYPDARFVWTHRQPEKILPSICSLIYQVRDIFHANQSPTLLGERQLKQWSLGISRLVRDRKWIGDERFFDLYHATQVKDPESGIRALYQWLGWEFTDEYAARLRSWREGNPQGQHKPDPHFFGLNLEDIKSHFVNYTAIYGSTV